VYRESPEDTETLSSLGPLDWLPKKLYWPGLLNTSRSLKVLFDTFMAILQSHSVSWGVRGYNGRVIRVDSVRERWAYMGQLQAEGDSEQKSP
jgi:hypothetical protein